MQFFASCPPGVADLTAAELRECGATQTAEFKLGVQFEGTLEAAYRACLWSRTASRVLMPLARFDAATPDALYGGVAAIAWHEHIGERGTFAVDFAGASSGITHTHFGALKTKDAIVDQFRERSGERPSVQLEQPDVRIDVRLDNDRATLSLDLSGESLHRRAYRARGVAAPLKENLAAAILLRSTWPAIAKAGGGLVDPMCGSGTLLIEAALMALDIAPGSMRGHFGFLGWTGHDAALWRRLEDEARDRRAATAAAHIDIRGYDSDPGAVRAALENIERAQLRHTIHVERRDVAALTKEGGDQGLLVTNPPYGERIGDQDRLRDLYALLGQRLRENFVGWKAAVFTGNPPLAKSLNINARRTHTLFNGRIECRLLRFDVEPSQFRGAAAIQTAEERREEIIARPGAQMFANRLAKNLKEALKWAKRESVHCFRVYDADMPEYAFAIDLYGDGPQGDGKSEQWAYVQEYAPPRTVEVSAAGKRRNEVLAVIPDVLKLPGERIHLRERRQQKGTTQYEKVDEAGEFHVVREGQYRFRVNFQDYLDTGLFLDHRLTRRYIGELAPGKHVLNLFAYTGSATVYAAGGGAKSTTTVDMSRTYIEWAMRNLALNGLEGPQHEFVQEDCLAWLREEHGPQRFDLMFIDPPTHSRSKRMAEDFDVQRDHGQLLNQAARLLADDGVIVFSNNFTRFKLDQFSLSGFDIQDITEQTLPWDYRRNRRIHSCFVLRRRR